MLFLDLLLKLLVLDNFSLRFRLLFQLAHVPMDDMVLEEVHSGENLVTVSAPKTVQQLPQHLKVTDLVLEQVSILF